MLTAYKGIVLGLWVRAGEPNRRAGVASPSAGQFQKFAGKPLVPTESSEEPNLANLFLEQGDV